MRLAISLTVASIVVIAAAHAAQAPQKSSGAVTETARVVVIEIPVHVVNKNGEPVRGLSAADFELTDDGKKAEISGVEVIDLNRVVAAAPAAKDPFPEAPPAGRPAALAARLRLFLLEHERVAARAGGDAGLRADGQEGERPRRGGDLLGGHRMEAARELHPRPRPAGPRGRDARFSQRRLAHDGSPRVRLLPADGGGGSRVQRRPERNRPGRPREHPGRAEHGAERFG